MTEHIRAMSGQYEEYLMDESKFYGFADSISFPESEEEIIQIIKELSIKQIPITIQGGKTGITGGAVPQGGHILNLSHMNQIKDSWKEEDGTGRIVVEPGINLMELRKEISQRFRKAPVFFPPDPTETSATLGGIAASGAQGISRLLYGDSRQYIESLHLITYDGKVREFKRGQRRNLLSLENIEELDMVLGKEGITGIISQLTLKLIFKPESIWGISFFFGRIKNAGAFVDRLKEELPQTERAAIAVVEYIDRSSIDLIEEKKASMTKIKELPDVPKETESMVYTEIHGREEDIEEIAEVLMETAMCCGSNPDEAWAVSGETDVEKMHAFRHSAAETVNLFIEERHRTDKRITKLGTDMDIQKMRFSDMIERYEKDLKNTGLKGCIFGHALENHLHINMLAENYEEYERAVSLIRRWAKQVHEQGGRIVVEHGIGKLKRQILEDVLPENYLKMCRELKDGLDRENMINPGNILI